MDARAEGLPWERQPREGEQAYAAFLAYRDLGPRRTYEATRKASAGPRATSSRSSGGRPCANAQAAYAWDNHLQAERDKVAAEEAAKWERRRLQALEEGWQLCQTLRARLAEMLAFTLEAPAAAPPEPSDAGGRPGGRRDARTGPADGGTRADAVGLHDGDAAVEADRRAGVDAAEWASRRPGSSTR